MTRVPIIDRKVRDLHASAAKRAVRSDIDWFLANPERLTRCREAIRFEFDGWKAQDHEGHCTLVRRTGSQVQRRALRGTPGAEHGMPDNERFLSLLWSHIEAAVLIGDKRPAITPEVHRELLCMAGLGPKEFARWI